MNLLRRTDARAVLVLIAAAVVAAVMPAFLPAPDVRDLTAAVALAGPAAGASVALATGRPSLASAGLAGAGAYTAGILTLHGWSSPAAVGAGTAAGATGGAVLAVAGGLLDGGAFLALSMLAAVAGGAAVLAAPGTTGAEAGLGPLPPLQVSVGGGNAVVLGTAGSLHAVLVVAVLAVVACALLLSAGPGPRWRASGGDVNRARATGAHPRRSRIEALALGGAAAGACGAVATLAAGVAEPSAFAVDAAVLPLMAALLAGRAGPVAAALAATATGVAGLLVLPSLGYTGPPSAVAMATGGLAAVTLVARVATVRRRHGTSTPPPGGAVPPPQVAAPRRGPAALVAAGLEVAAPHRGPILVTDLRLAVPPGTVQGLAGPNGAGKSSVLAALLRGCERGDPRVGPAGGGVVLVPQAGGGLAGCTVRETLGLAARAGGLDGEAAGEAVAAWLDHLGPAAPPGARCETLSAGSRRRLDLARALLLRPTVLLADEPLAGLGDTDRAAAVLCLRAAAAAGVAVLVAEHDLATLGTLAASVTWIDRDGTASAVAVAAP